MVTTVKSVALLISSLSFLTIAATGCEKNRSGAAGASDCSLLAGTRLDQDHDLGLKHPINCIAIARKMMLSDVTSDQDHLSISLWGVESTSAPNIFFPENNYRGLLEVGTTYEVTPTGFSQTDGLEVSPADLSLKKLASSTGELTTGTIVIKTVTTATGAVHEAAIEFSVPTIVETEKEY